MSYIGLQFANILQLNFIKAIFFCLKKVDLRIFFPFGCKNQIFYV